MLEALCWLLVGHRWGPWEDFTEVPFEDGMTFAIRRCRWCGYGEMRTKPYDMARLERAARLDGFASSHDLDAGPHWGNSGETPAWRR